MGILSTIAALFSRREQPKGTVQTVTVHTETLEERYQSALKVLEDDYPGITQIPMAKATAIVTVDLLRRVKRLEHKTRPKGMGGPL